MKQSHEFSQAQLVSLTTDNKVLNEDVKKLTEGMSQLSGENRKMKETILDLRAHSMRDNLVFSGILEWLGDKRPDKNVPRAIVAKFEHHKQKNT